MKYNSTEEVDLGLEACPPADVSDEFKTKLKNALFQAYQDRGDRIFFVAFGEVELEEARRILVRKAKHRCYPGRFFIFGENITTIEILDGLEQETPGTIIIR